jgi:calcineurin-like phosphoesterase family protein
MIWFVADTHFDHENIIDLADRPFDDVEQMNHQMIKQWNNRIKKNDIVYHLGDFAFGRDRERIKELRNTLNGEIRLLIGNHDDRRAIEEVFGPTWMPRGLWRIRHEGERIVICHYSLRTWEGQHYGAWHLFGHSHGSLSPFGKSVDVGVDAPFLRDNSVGNDNWGAPYSFPEIKSFMETRQVAVPDQHQVASRR